MNEPTKEQKGSSSTLIHDESAGASATDIRQAAVAASIPQPASTDDKGPAKGTDAHKLRRLDYGFLPIPKSRRYDPANAQFSPFLNYLFAFVSCIEYRTAAHAWRLTFDPFSSSLAAPGEHYDRRQSLLLPTSPGSILGVFRCIVRPSHPRPYGTASWLCWRSSSSHSPRRSHSPTPVYLAAHLYHDDAQHRAGRDAIFHRLSSHQLLRWLLHRYPASPHSSGC